jgi:hypothetical protein
LRTDTHFMDLLTSILAFSIAVLRGHRDLARALVEISYAQYQPPEQDKPKRYRLANEAEEEDEDEDMSDGENVGILEEIVDDKFTIENIGELPTQVKSEITPLRFMTFSCPAWDYAKMFHPDKQYTYGLDKEIIHGTGTVDLQSWSITTNDRSLFMFMLDLDIEWTDRLAKMDGSSGIPSLSTSDFNLAMKYGRVDFLVEMIKHFGAGMELESLVKQSGVKFLDPEKNKYYQGLSVHGKKRSDWVQAARGMTRGSVSDANIPLLQAAFKGSLECAEFFLSDTPARHYLDYAEAYKNHKLIDHLNKNAGGFERILRKWLGARRELVLHCAIMAKPGVETTKLIKYLLQALPDSLEVKSADGLTPLALAISLHRLDAAKLLVEAGADQTTRDRSGSNILHLLLYSDYTSSVIDDKDVLKSFLDLIDKRLISSLLTERCALDPGSLTPIANWLRRSRYSTHALRTLLDFAAPTNNEHLELLDGSGDTPLHYLVQTQRQDCMKTILEYRPDLLYRENSVGRTPYELAEDAYIAERVSQVPRASSYRNTRSLTDRDAATFAKGYKEDEGVNKESLWRVCEEWLGKSSQQKRTLVSLNEANEVAKRLAGRYKQTSYRREADESDIESKDGEEEAKWGSTKDEVSQWIRSAPNNPDN